MTGIIQTKKDRPNYYAVLDYKDEHGARKRPWINTDVPVKGNNKRKAQQKLQEILAKYAQDEISPSKDMLFLDFLDLWLETHKPSIAPTTYDTYQMIINRHIVPYFKAKKLKVTEVTPTILQQYVNQKRKQLSANSVRKHLANISTCLDTAVKQNIIAYNPVKRIEKPKKTKFDGAKFYTERQIEALFEVSKGDPLEIVILLTLFYGLRRSEVVGLKWDAIDFEEKTLSIQHTVIPMGKTLHKLDRTKSASSRASFPMPEKIITELQAWRCRQLELQSLQPNDYEDNGYICTKPNGQLFSPNFVSQHFRLLLKNNNLPHIRFHDLRHSSASYLKALGFDLKDIQTWLRHDDIRTTMNIYTHLDMDAKANIADVLNKNLSIS